MGEKSLAMGIQWSKFTISSVQSYEPRVRMKRKNKEINFDYLNFRAREQLKYHCAVFSAHLKYRWSPRSCTDEHYFVCQHRMPLVSSKNRQRVYQKWNQTFPNELANENEVIIANKNRYFLFNFHNDTMRT